MLSDIQNKTSFIVCRYVGRLLSYSEKFQLSEIDRLELLMDLEETYNIDINPKQFNLCETIKEIENLLLRPRKSYEVTNIL